MRFPVTSFIIVTFSLSLWTLLLMTALKTFFSGPIWVYLGYFFLIIKFSPWVRVLYPLLLSGLIFFLHIMLYIICCRKSEICLPLWSFCFYQIVQLIAIILSFISIFFLYVPFGVFAFFLSPKLSPLFWIWSSPHWSFWYQLNAWSAQGFGLTEISMSSTLLSLWKFSQKS